MIFLEVYIKIFNGFLFVSREKTSQTNVKIVTPSTIYINRKREIVCGKEGLPVFIPYDENLSYGIIEIPEMQDTEEEF